MTVSVEVPNNTGVAIVANSLSVSGAFNMRLAADRPRARIPTR